MFHVTTSIIVNMWLTHRTFSLVRKYHKRSLPANARVRGNDLRSFRKIRKRKLSKFTSIALQCNERQRWLSLGTCLTLKLKVKMKENMLLHILHNFLHTYSFIWYLCCVVVWIGVVMLMLLPNVEQRNRAYFA